MKRITYSLAVLLLCALLLPLSGCSEGDEEVSEVTSTENPGPPVVPADPDLSTPESAVAAYLDWISYAYRTADSEVATAVMTPYELVRVDSYIELNRQEGVALDQELLKIDIVDSNIRDEDDSFVSAHEEWEYRYFSISEGIYTTDRTEVQYDTFYSLRLEGDDWLVDSVEATPLEPLEEQE